MYGKIKYIDFTTASLKNDLEFRYDPMGNRTMKIEYASTGAKYTFYSRDAQGNIMATYTMTDDANDYVYLDEFDIYGSSRLGVNNIGKKMTELTWSGSSFSFTTGNKQYELTNHLGNVLATISDHKLPFSSNVNDGTVDYFLADITSSQDYYPFGMIMPERNWNSSTYRFGFNGQEMDNEISGQTGTHTTAMFWEYDARLGRRWNVDPKPTVRVSSYACFANNPIVFSDIRGDSVKGDVDTYNKFKSYVGELIKGLNDRISEIDNSIIDRQLAGKKTKSLERERARLKHRIGRYEEVLSECSTLESSPINYFINTSYSGSGRLSYDIINNYVVVNVNMSDYGWARIGHELKHAYQYETYQLSFYGDGIRSGTLSSIWIEVDAYKRSQLFGLYVDKEITPGFVRGIRFGLYDYPDDLHHSMSSMYHSEKDLTIGGFLKLSSFHAGKRGGKTLEYWRDWQIYYELGTMARDIESQKVEKLPPKSLQ